MNYIALLIFFVTTVILSVFVNKVGYAISEIVELKSKCEAGLPRNKQCVLVSEEEND